MKVPPGTVPLFDAELLAETIVAEIRLRCPDWEPNRDSDPHEFRRRRIRLVPRPEPKKNKETA